MKGQVMEMLGFLALSITIIGIVLFMRVYLTGGYGKSFTTIMDRHNTESLRASVNSIFQTTQKTSSKKLIELLGISVSLRQKTFDLNVGGEIDLEKEFNWRFDQVFGKDRWYIIIYPNDGSIQNPILTFGKIPSSTKNIRSVTIPLVINDIEFNNMNVYYW